MEIREAIERSMHTQKIVQSVEHRSRYPWDMDFLQKKGILYSVDFLGRAIVVHATSAKRGFNVIFSYLS